MTEAELSTKLSELETNFTAALTKQQELEGVNKRLQEVIKLSAEEREVFDALPAEKQDAYLAADTTARKDFAPAEEEESGDLDPVVAKRFADMEVRHKEEIAKRDRELEEVRKKAQEAEEVAKREQDRAERAEFAKRAESELSNYSGKPEEKGDLLRALHGGVKKCLSPENVEGLAKLLAAGNEALGKMMIPIGGDGSGSTTKGVIAKAEAKARELISKSDGKLTMDRAMAQVWTQEPSLYEEYERERRATN